MLTLVMLPIGGNILEDLRPKIKNFKNAIMTLAPEEKFLIQRFCLNQTKKKKGSLYDFSELLETEMNCKISEFLELSFRMRI